MGCCCGCWYRSSWWSRSSMYSNSTLFWWLWLIIITLSGCELPVEYEMLCWNCTGPPVAGYVLGVPWGVPLGVPFGVKVALCGELRYRWLGLTVVDPAETDFGLVLEIISRFGDRELLLLRRLPAELWLCEFWGVCFNLTSCGASCFWL